MAADLKKRNIWRALLLLAILLPFSGPARAAGDEVVVFAAASMTETISSLGERFEEKTGLPVIASFAGSGTLARQISEGAPANVFVSANMKWLQFLDDEKMLVPGSLVTMASNSLELVAPKETPEVMDFDVAKLPELLGDGRLAIGDPESVPVGTYSKGALENLGLWEDVQKKAVMLPNVRAVLALVERGEVPYAIIYGTDLKLAKNIRLVTTFPEESHPPIVYGMALIKDHDTHSAKQFYDFIQSDEGGEIIRSFGFMAVEN